MIAKKQLRQIEDWVYANARPLEAAKWNLLFGKGTQEALTQEIRAYQNPDGGFGGGFENDIRTPESCAIAGGEAVFTAQDYGLALTTTVWGKRLLSWFGDTASGTPSFWEPVPPSLEDFPHPFYWSYRPDTEFSPNPCAVAASALLQRGATGSQRALGERIVEKCAEYILYNEDYRDHDTYCLQRLYGVMGETRHPLFTAALTGAMDRRILNCACTDSSKWQEYVAQPLDLVDSPHSCWYGLLADVIPGNLDYWEQTLTADGYWPPNFGWNEAPEGWLEVWLGYIAVKRVKILKAFGRIEGYN